MTSAANAAPACAQLSTAARRRRVLPASPSAGTPACRPCRRPPRQRRRWHTPRRRLRPCRRRRCGQCKSARSGSASRGRWALHCCAAADTWLPVHGGTWGTVQVSWQVLHQPSPCMPAPCRLLQCGTPAPAGHVPSRMSQVIFEASWKKIEEKYKDVSCCSLALCCSFPALPRLPPLPACNSPVLPQLLLAWVCVAQMHMAEGVHLATARPPQS